ncbi:hypothetical protein SEMRO_27_G018000.1 [Seminavis robusta]|uniref:Uncharacterized protein n=1 Tax=Seminavis robusta TaxID=568900 RepID=A0A9N8D9S4_9STRA|nr:hypothetical protein SEMRO_27_G018000.1 [Seminavis robusta]|eukprot:Sro27_g018000.1 n/a (103) ;mRNA; r:7546-7854
MKNKPERVAKWKQLKGKPAPDVNPWTDAEEEALVKLKRKIDGDIALDDTAFARRRDHEVDTAKSLIRGLSKEEKEAFLKTIQEDDGDSDDSDGDSDDSDGGN